MAQSYDAILKGGTVVNQDGTGERDIAVRDGRIVAISSSAARWRVRPLRRSIAKACTCCPA